MKKYLYFEKPHFVTVNKIYSKEDLLKIYHRDMDQNHELISGKLVEYDTTQIQWRSIPGMGTKPNHLDAWEYESACLDKGTDGVPGPPDGAVLALEITLRGICLDHSHRPLHDRMLWVDNTYQWLKDTYSKHPYTDHGIVSIMLYKYRDSVLPFTVRALIIPYSDQGEWMSEEAIDKLNSEEQLNDSFMKIHEIEYLEDGGKEDYDPLTECTAFY